MNTLVAEKKISTAVIMQDIILDITWSKVAQRYFPDKSIPWFYNKLRGVDGNGGTSDFNYSERLQLRNALFDFSERVRYVAENIEV